MLEGSAGHYLDEISAPNRFIFKVWQTFLGHSSVQFWIYPEATFLGNLFLCLTTLFVIILFAYVQLKISTQQLMIIVSCSFLVHIREKTVFPITTC